VKNPVNAWPIAVKSSASLSGYVAEPLEALLDFLVVLGAFELRKFLLDEVRNELVDR
jgi:hypothetical protein